jgi:lipopolysaccharide assembly outer membrane protein LptD (OstA)
VILTDFNSNDIEAYGVVDTSDTLGKSFTETPELIEGDQVYEGFRLRYNFKTQRGLISLAKNEEGETRYEGEKVKKVDKDTYFIEDGIYTTCSEDPPHTYFTAERMKIIYQDKIIARWVFMYVGGVPFPIPIPFIVLPNESGRRSGIIVPAYGQDVNRGPYFRNLGYFLAINDYMDFALTGDYYTKGGYGLRGRYRYAKRYEFNGNINGGYSVLTRGETSDPDRFEQIDWNLSIFHNQQFNPTLRLDVNMQFQSSNYIQNNSVDYNELLSKDLISNATLTKQWPQSGNSLTLNYNRSQNLESGNVNEVIPNISFNKSISYPFRSNPSASGGSSSDLNWYEMIAYDYTGQGRINRRKTEEENDVRGGIQHRIGLNASPKVGYFSISPRIGYNSKWYTQRVVQRNIIVTDTTTQIVGGEPTEIITERDSIVTEDINEINFVRTFDFSLSASTRIYGMSQPQIFGIEAIRHTLTPSISYNYSPDFSEDMWGYYDTYTLASGEVVKYDKFQKEIFGGSGAGKRQSLNFSVGNVFEIKTMKDPTDTTSEAQKIQLLNLTGSVGYNFGADSLRLSDLRLSYRTQIGDLLNLSGSSSYTFYDYSGSRKVDKFLVSEGKGLFRLTNLNFAVSTSLSGDKIEGEDRAPVDTLFDDGLGTYQRPEYIDVFGGEEEPDFSIPWNLNLDYTYSLSKPTPTGYSRNQSIGVNMGFSLTKNWKFTVRGSYDLEQKEISAPQVTVYRDLHCWEMFFSWNPLGAYQGFRVEIRLKAPELQDIKIERAGGLFTGRR